MKYLWILAICFVGCTRNHLYVQQEWLDAAFLASSRIGTPDSRKADPPQGQRLLIAWRFPRDLLEEILTLRITVRFWDNAEEVVFVPVEISWRQMAVDFPKATADRRILTYRVEVVTEKGEVIETWKHPLWTELIQIG